MDGSLGPPHRDGAMIAGGLGYPLDELAELPDLPRHSCGIPALDHQAGGGISPGSVWTIAAPGRSGCTALVVRAAVAAARTATVVLVNGHVATHLLRDHVVAELGRQRASDGARARLALASWKPLPDVKDISLGETDTEMGQADVVILDALDEMWRPGAWPQTSDDAIRQLRWLRELARGAGTAFLLTARVPPGFDFHAAWPTHRLYPAFADVADVAIELSPQAEVPTSAYIRGVGGWAASSTRGMGVALR